MDRCMRSGSARRTGMTPRARGFTYVMLLAAVALAGLALAALGPMWAEQSQREREQELLRVGQAYARAIASYYNHAPSGAIRYPQRLSDLLHDTRAPAVRRHLRRLYPDPLDPQRAWGLVRAEGGGIAGVFSEDARRPWRRGAFTTAIVDLPAEADDYSEWKFTPRQP